MIIFKNCYVTIVIYKVISVCRYRIKHSFELITVKTRNFGYSISGPINMSNIHNILCF